MSVGFPSPLAALLLVIGVVALVYLWLCGRCEALGKDITRLEQEKKILQSRTLNEEFKWSNLKSSRTMETILKQHHLAMALPPETCVVRVRPAQMETAEQPVPAQFAHRRDDTAHD